ncbi:uncharacterized protein BDR25DRAFT_195642, partial [Lindgomyces ingoldianus]
GSSRNFYLVTCSDKNEGDYDAIAYYADGPQEKPEDWPDKVAQVSKPPGTWEGHNREANIYDDSWFTAKISSGAEHLKKGEIAGTGDFEGEAFVCFKRDGETLYSASDVICREKYWCPSVDVSE